MKKLLISILITSFLPGFLHAQIKVKLFAAYNDERARNNDMLKSNDVGSVWLIHGNFFPTRLVQSVNYSLLEQNVIKQVPDINQSGLMVLDWEGEWFNVLSGKSADKNSAVFDNVIDEYIKVVNYVKKIRPNLQISYYGIPFKSFNVNERNLIAKNKLIIKLINKIDFLAPSLYFYNYNRYGDVIESNINSVRMNLTVLNNIKSIENKPMYVFVWNRWHPNSDNDKGDLIPADTFTALIKKMIAADVSHKIDGLIWYLNDYTVAAFKGQMLNNSKVELFSPKSSVFLTKNYKLNPVGYQNDVFYYYYSALKSKGGLLR